MTGLVLANVMAKW